MRTIHALVLLISILCILFIWIVEPLNPVANLNVSRISATALIISIVSLYIVVELYRMDK